MRQDTQGYFYFVDRIGDTFRWKGENVAAGEVTEAVLDCPGVTDAMSFGVRVPGHDGRAGMAAIVAGPDFDVEALGGLLSRRLPAYAHPLLLRLCERLPNTETFKQKKQQLMHDGFDPDVVTDPLYLGDPGSGAYRLLDRVLCAWLTDGLLRLTAKP